jgi:Fur family ferric uptake transcriptional regulator
LKNQKFVEEFQLDDGIKRYEMFSDHHHHTVCLKCKKIKCVKLKNELGRQEREVERKNKFKIINHSLEFYGLCRSCRQA